VIVTDDGQLSAHSVVLTAASPVFKAALKVGDKPREHIIVIPGVKSSLMSTVLQLVYTGEIVPVPKDMAAVMSLMLELQLVCLQQTEYVAGVLQLTDTFCHCLDCFYCIFAAAVASSSCLTVLFF